MNSKIDLDLDAKTVPHKGGRWSRLHAAGVAASISLAVVVGLTATYSAGYAIPLFDSAPEDNRSLVRLDLGDVSSLNVDDKAQIVVAGEDAQSRNEAIPLSGLPLQKPGRLVLGSSDKTYEAALQCLSQAVYYEAAVEPMEGRRAVAQVVINRVRHPAYPSSICGVVYQGAERRTGCQFSFTCDGSLLRKPGGHTWQEARQVAREALAGHVEQSVGTATHYHADYVLPKWAFALGKIEKLGRHIFYRFKGNWGRSAAFSERYSGAEHVPVIDLALLQQRLEERGEKLAGDAFVPGLTVTPHVTDRHAENDVGGRIDTTKPWRLSIPDPVEASSRYREAVAEESEDLPTPSGHIALAGNRPDEVNP